MPGPRPIRPFRPPRPADDIRLRRPDLLRRLDRDTEGGPITGQLRPGAFELPDAFWETELPGLRLPPKNRPIPAYLPTLWEPGMGPWGDPTPPRDPSLFAEALRSLSYGELLQLAAKRMAQDIGGHFEDGAVAAVVVGMGRYVSQPPPSSDPSLIASRRDDGRVSAGQTSWARPQPTKAHNAPADWMMRALEDGKMSQPGGSRSEGAKEIADLIQQKLTDARPNGISQQEWQTIVRRCAGKWVKVTGLDSDYFGKLSREQWTQLGDQLAHKVSDLGSLGINEVMRGNVIHRHSVQTMQSLLQKYKKTVILLAVQSDEPLARAKEIMGLRNIAAAVARKHPDKDIRRFASTVGNVAARNQNDTSEGVRRKADRIIEAAMAAKDYVQKRDDPFLTRLIGDIVHDIINSGQMGKEAGVTHVQSLIAAIESGVAIFLGHGDAMLNTLAHRFASSLLLGDVTDRGTIDGRVKEWIRRYVGRDALDPKGAPNQLRPEPPSPAEGRTPPQPPSIPNPIDGQVSLAEVSVFLSQRSGGTIPVSEVDRAIRVMLKGGSRRRTADITFTLIDVSVRKNGNGKEDVIITVRYSHGDTSAQLEVKGKVGGYSTVKNWDARAQEEVTITSIYITPIED